MLNNVFDECPGFEFFSAEDVLRVRSLGLPDDFELWEHEHFELVSSVLGVSTELMYERLRYAFGGGSAGWEFYCDWYDGLSLDELEAEGLPAGEVMRWFEEGCLVGDVWKPAFSSSEGVPGLRFTRAQFWGGAGKGVWGASGEGGLRFNSELFECVRVFSRLGVSADAVDMFLFYPSREYGFLTAAELLLSGDEGLRALVLADARVWALKSLERQAVEDWVRVGVGSVPVPGNVVALTVAGIVPSVGDGSVRDLGALSEVLRVPSGVLVHRLAGAGKRSGGVRWCALPVGDVAAGVGVSVDDVRLMCEQGELLVERRKSGELWVSEVHLMPAGRDDVLVDDWVLFPDSVRLVRELRGLGWGDSRVVEFLVEPSPWFGLVAPVEYARLGGEYVDAVLEVARYLG